jgi:hypothetical protein
MTTTTDVMTTPGMPVPDGWVAGTWVIDPAHTTVGFAVRHLMSRVRGTFSEVSGQLRPLRQASLDPAPQRLTAAAGRHRGRRHGTRKPCRPLDRRI